jgi:signal transduction histidine kinase
MRKSCWLHLSQRLSSRTNNWSLRWNRLSRYPKQPLRDYIVVSYLLMVSTLWIRVRYAEEFRRQTLIALTLSHQEVTLARDRAQEQEQFLAMLTHELTTPLSVASLALSKLSETSAIRTRAYRAVDSMRGIIERVSLADRLDRDNSLLRREVVDVTALLRELREQFNDDDQTGPRIALRLEGRMQCQTERQLLAMVMGNLMDNALKYGAGEVMVAGRAQDRGQQPGLLLAVSNPAGPSGRPDPTHLFEKYHRGRAAMGKPGTGLGLYLSALITKRLGGELRHLPEADDVRFELWLPA